MATAVANKKEFEKEFGEAHTVVRFLFLSRGVSHRNIVELLLTSALSRRRSPLSTSKYLTGVPLSVCSRTDHCWKSSPRVIIVVLLVSLSLAAYWSFLSRSLYLTLAAARKPPSCGLCYTEFPLCVLPASQI